MGTQNGARAFAIKSAKRYTHAAHTTLSRLAHIYVRFFCVCLWSGAKAAVCGWGDVEHVFRSHFIIYTTFYFGPEEDEERVAQTH